MTWFASPSPGARARLAGGFSGRLPKLDLSRRMIWVVVVVALAGSCSGGTDAERAIPTPDTSWQQGAYLRVDAEGNSRIGPTEVEPGYVVDLPKNWVAEAPGDGEEVRLRNGGSLMTVQRLAPKGELDTDFAHLVVEASRDQGRTVEMVGEPRHRPIAGETALVFDEFEQEPTPAVLSRFVLFDHEGVRFLTSFTTLEPTLAPAVDVFDEILRSWVWTDG